MRFLASVNNDNSLLEFDRIREIPLDSSRELANSLLGRALLQKMFVLKSEITRMF
jgi:hypothetical protein